MTRPATFLLLGIGGVLVGFVGGGWMRSRNHATQVGDVVAMSWGDGKYGESFYGAQVYVEPAGLRFVVRAQVHVGHGNPMYEDCGVLGTEDSFPEAVRKWGKIDWQPDGLHIGSYFLPRSRLENHR